MDLEREELMAGIRRLLERDHRGRDNPITMTRLFQLVTGDVVIPGRRYDQTRVIRSCVKELRRQGLPIVHKGGASGGYYLATDSADIERTANLFHSRAMSSLVQEAALRRMRPGDLLEQYQLELEEQRHESR